MEQWDLYDKNRLPLKKSINKGEDIIEGEYRMVVHVIIFNQQGQMLIQKRNQDKKNFPGLWDLSVSGSAIKGEQSFMAAQRETEEEIGYNIDLSNKRPNFTINFDKGFDDIYIINLDMELAELTIQEEEVEQLGWASEKELFNLWEKGDFIPYKHSFLKTLFEQNISAGMYK